MRAGMTGFVFYNALLVRALFFFSFLFCVGLNKAMVGQLVFFYIFTCDFESSESMGFVSNRLNASSVRMFS